MGKEAEVVQAEAERRKKGDKRLESDSTDLMLSPVEK
jgi:hypothetical protein